MLLDIERANAQARPFCWSCRQPSGGCYCVHVRAFDPAMSFVILIHKIESRRRIATGRMSHLMLKSSRLIEGDCFEDNALVNSLIADPEVFPVVLYPGAGSIDVSNLTPADQTAIVPANRRLLIFVIDGTWATARRTMRLSTNLARLPRVCFSPVRESQFKVRKQPAAHCVSTIEAIHHTIELLGDSQGFKTATRMHDGLLDVFSFMVERQSGYMPTLSRAKLRE